MMKKRGAYGIPDPFEHKFHSFKNDLQAPHPLEAKYETLSKNEDLMNMTMLRRVQGIHAPFKLKMEQTMVEKTGHLPCLRRSHFMRDVLTGQDETLDFKDYLGCGFDGEEIRQPYNVIERHMGLQ